MSIIKKWLRQFVNTKSIKLKLDLVKIILTFSRIQ